MVLLGLLEFESRTLEGHDGGVALEDLGSLRENVHLSLQLLAVVGDLCAFIEHILTLVLELGESTRELELELTTDPNDQELANSPRYDRPEFSHHLPIIGIKSPPELLGRGGRGPVPLGM